MAQIDAIYNMKCGCRQCGREYKTTRAGGRKFKVHRMIDIKTWEYASKLESMSLWVCGDHCKANVEWLGDWNSNQIVFRREEVNGNGDCLFEALSSPGLRVVTRTGLLNWLNNSM
jgi:hypothetical protein